MIENLGQYLDIKTGKIYGYRQHGYGLNVMELKLFGLPYGTKISKMKCVAPIYPVEKVIYNIHKMFPDNKGIKRVAVFCHPESFNLNRNEWLRCRRLVLKTQENKCVICGSTDNLHVDHKLPRKYFPELSYVMENLHVMCDKCNMSKSSKVEQRYIDALKGLGIIV